MNSERIQDLKASGSLGWPHLRPRYKPLPLRYKRKRKKETRGDVLRLVGHCGWTAWESMDNVLMNTELAFSGWCVNWIDAKKENWRPLRWPLSMGTCLERNPLNDPGVRGWPGRPRLTPGQLNSWGHLASFEIRCPQSASIWQRLHPH